MQVYSRKIIQFISEIKGIVKDVLSKEIGLKVYGDRFYNRQQTTSYPINIVVYNNRKMLGYFEYEFFALGFHEILMRTSKEQLRNIIRHELGHYLTIITHGDWVQAHGREFRAFCQLMGWSEDVYSATTCLDDGAAESQIEECGVLRKVQKLMALSTSSNQNEAEQAMIKSQQLLLKHNLDAKYIGAEDEEKVCLKRILKQKKESAKMRAIANILQTFFVNTVFTRAGDYSYVEIVGSEVNVEIAEYVADFLNNEFDELWDQARVRHHNLKGMVAKNSFFMGIAMGYCEKIHALKRGYDAEVSNALMVIEKKLVDAKEMVYPHLRKSRSSGQYCQESAFLGELAGRQLNIKSGIGSSATASGLCLAFGGSR